MSGFRIKRKIAVFVAVGLAAFAWFALPVGAQTSASCPPPDSSTLANNSFARVYGRPNGQAFVCVKATGKRTRLPGASASQDQFALGGQWVGWSSGPEHTIVNVMHIPDRAIPQQFPYETNDHIDKIVVKSSGAAAWAASPSGDNTYVQGMDRRNHSADQLSDDTLDVVGSSLKSRAGHRISWKYTDGSSGSANLY